MAKASNKSQPKRKVALTLMAHPDDAEILCSGTLARLAKAGWEIHIATATAGDCGTMTETPWKIGAIRTEEARKAAAIIGGTAHCLGELDALVVYDKPTLKKAYDLFRQIAPSLVITHSPNCYMMDHVMISMVARAAAFVYGAPNISQFPLHPGSGVPHLYYADPLELINAFGNPVAPTTLIDVSKEMATKVKMLAAHSSQREWLRAHHHMDQYIESMKQQGAARGELAGVKYAEGFVQHLGHGYPHDDLLGRLLGNKLVSCDACDCECQ